MKEFFIGVVVGIAILIIVLAGIMIFTDDDSDCD